MESNITQDSMMAERCVDSTLMGEIQLSELPAIINSQVEVINDLGKKIESALEKANNAKTKASEAENLKYRIGQRGEMVTTIRDVTLKLAESQSETTEALSLTFTNEKKLADITKSLFALGMYSLEHTDVVIRRLTEELSNESKESSLSDVAKQRLREVISQLESQKKITDQQSELAGKLDSHNQRITQNTVSIAALQAKSATAELHINNNLAQIEGANARISEVHGCLSQELSELKKQAVDDKKKIESSISTLERKVDGATRDFQQEISTLKTDLENKNNATNRKLESLEARVLAIEEKLNKKWWKIAVSATAGTSLLLTILHVLGLI